MHRPQTVRKVARHGAIPLFTVASLAIAFCAPGKPAPVSFAKQIAPILKAQCLDCHGPDGASGGLRLDSQAMVQKGGRSGALFVPGKSAQSLLYKRITQSGANRMPQGQPALPAAQIELIRTWIDQGAKFDGAAGKHWAYVSPVKAALPKVASAEWSVNPIDRFVLSKLTTSGLHPSPEASKATLLRRVCYDLTGLPPTLEQQHEYLTDARPDAYERLVDRLLDSPAYGERMATPWLDLARYADTNGYEKDNERTIWPYRDWVVKAFNADMPYDQFTIKQIAGDLLPDPTTDDLIATGFSRNTMKNEEGGVDQGEQRWLTLVDRVGTTGSVFLGSTLMCCQCHDHKYDPFTQEDFYKLLAFYQSSDEPRLPLYDKSVDAMAVKVAELKKEFADKSAPATKAETETLQALEDQVNQARENTTLILREKPDAYPPSDFMRIKGAYLSPGKKVIAGTPKVLPPMPSGVRDNRLGMARWLVARDNPLTARVEVNRLWSMLFGVGLVKTEGDFGTQGERPIYGELLDWLAVDFMERGWSMKAILREIVTSKTYRQSSVETPLLADKDPENRLLARGARFRLSAEMVRDNALAAGGLLSHKMGGPPVMPDQPDGIWNLPYSDAAWHLSQGEDRFRRGLYTYWRRTMPYPSFLAFDATSREACTVNRTRTNTPLQALVLLDDPVYQMAARGLATQMLAASSDPAAELAIGFQTLMVRKPSPVESTRLLTYYREQEARLEKDPAAAQALLGKEGPIGKATPAQSGAAIMVGRVLMNLDEAITKE